MYRDSYVNIDVDALKNNIKEIIKTYSGYKYYFGVVKANCYGHGEYLVNKMIEYCGKDFKIEEKYLNRMKVFFERRDKKNCERIYLSCKD